MRSTITLRRLKLALTTTAFLSCAAGAHALPQAATDPASKTAAIQEAKPLPSAKELVAKMIEFQGGEKALANPESIHAVGTFSVPMMNLSGSLQTWSAPPNLMLVEMDIPAMGGKSLQGYDGTVGWSIDPINGAQLLEGAILKNVARDADLRGDLDIFKNYDSVKVSGRETFDDVECVVLELKVDELTSQRFIDPETGRMVGSKSIMPTPQGDLPVETRIVEWKMIDGRNMATDTRMKMMGMEQVLKLDTVKPEKIDAKRFELPPAIAALVAERKKSEEGAKDEKPASDAAGKPSKTGGE